MKQIINKTEYNFSNDILSNDILRQSFSHLSKKIFNLDFGPWYQSGYWHNRYIPYTLSYQNTVIANVSVSPMTFCFKNETKCYVQLGTVMSAPEYREKGLSRWLINVILKEWESKCDAFFLFANDSVRKFYPKFGFIEATQYQYRKTIHSIDNEIRKLDMSLNSDKQLLLNQYQLSNPFSVFPMVKNTDLLMFYCLQYLKNNIYYIEKCQAIVIAETDDNSLLCYDIFCPANVGMDAVLASVAPLNTQSVVLGFTPKNTVGVKSQNCTKMILPFLS